MLRAFLECGFCPLAKWGQMPSQGQEKSFFVNELV